jgi:hypothetical protein
LLSQNAIFFTKIGNDPQLALIHPAGDSDQHEPEWIQYSQHVGLLSQQPVKNLNKITWIQYSDHTGADYRVK